MKGTIRKHHKSEEHSNGRMHWCSEKDRKIPEHVVNMQDRCKDHVMTCIKFAYFVAKQDLAIVKYEALCDLGYTLNVKDMPIQKDYSSYTNFMAGKVFLKCISYVLEHDQKNALLASPYFSILVDETMDRSLEKHLIVYITFLAQAGLGSCKNEFLKLKMVIDGCAQTKYDALVKVINDMGLDMKRRLVGIATDGDRSMLGCHDGLVAKLTRNVPHLISVHCVAHREALPVSDAYVLHDLDILNKSFPKDTLDIASFSTCVEVTLSSLRRKFLAEVFAKDTLYLRDFIENTKYGILMHTNEEGKEYCHQLKYEAMPGKDKKTKEALDKDDGSLDACIAMAKIFVQQVIDCVNDRYPNMYFFNDSKLFSPQHYPRDEDEREKKCSLWLARLLDRFGGHVVCVDGCKKELRSFVDTLYYGCEGMSCQDAWRVFSNKLSWHETFVNLMKVWQSLLVLPISTASCERGFSKQNIIKNDRREGLKVQTLDILMRISLLGLDVALMDWEKVYASWESILIVFEYRSADFDYFRVFYYPMHGDTNWKNVIDVAPRATRVLQSTQELSTIDDVNRILDDNYDYTSEGGLFSDAKLGYSSTSTDGSASQSENSLLNAFELDTNAYEIDTFSHSSIGLNLEIILEIDHEDLYADITSVP
ncbi:hypothetical protein L7F22_018065 [Adiantum nelumboides]|nr:hypothetical protein [Adiantum nelumboides]